MGEQEVGMNFGYGVRIVNEFSDNPHLMHTDYVATEDSSRHCLTFDSDATTADAVECLRAYAAFLDGEDADEGLPKPRKVNFHNPATVVYWDEGDHYTKTVARCHGGDEYDPLFGVMACVMRKLTDNKGHMVDEYEGSMRELAASVHSLEDLDELIVWCKRLIDMLTVVRDSSGLWMPKIGPADEQKDEPEDEPEPKPSVAECAADGCRFVPEVDPDMLRQQVRNLIDEGEL